jgi:hypothetical protein
LPAKIVNDDAGKLDVRGVLRFIAGKPGPTGGHCMAWWMRCPVPVGIMIGAINL